MLKERTTPMPEVADLGAPAVARVRREGAVELERLFQDHHVELVRLAGLLTGSNEEANDVVAEVFARLARHDRVDADQPRAYLRKAIVNEVMSRRRRSARRRTIDERYPARPVDAPGADEHLADQRRVLAALDALSSRQRTAVVLRYYEDLTEAQTAAAMGIAVGTVKSTVSRGLAALRAALDDEEVTAR